jgi:hypothetical protein
MDSKTIKILIGGGINWWNNGKMLIQLGGGENLRGH